MTDQKPTSPPDDPRARLEALRRAAARAESTPSANPAPEGLPPTASGSAASVPPGNSTGASPASSTSASPAPTGETPNASHAGALAVSPQTPSTGHKIGMAFGLLVMTGLGSIPALLLLWGVGSILGVTYIAEALERTDGLVPTTFGGAFWLAVVFLGVLVLMEIGTWFPKGDVPTGRGGCLTALLTRPAFAAVLLVLPTVLLVRMDLRGTDVPDVVTTTALLCVLGYGLFVLPLAFVASAIRLARWLWRVGSGSSFRSGLVAGSATVLGALLPTCMVCAPPEHPVRSAPEAAVAQIRGGRDALGEDVGRKGYLEGTLAALTQAAEVIPGTSGPWPLPPALLPDLQRTVLEDCVTRLATSPRGRATVEQATDWLIRNRRADRDTANSVAYATVLSVCLVHAREALDNPVAYYWKSVRQNHCKNYQRNPLRECAAFEDESPYCNAGFPFDGPRELDRVIELRTKLCRLEGRDREIVLGTLEGRTSRELGTMLGLNDANVRQRLKRALEKIRDD